MHTSESDMAMKKPRVGQVRKTVLESGRWRDGAASW